MNAPARVSTEERWWWFGELATSRVASGMTDGALSVFEIVAPPHLSVPRHVHHCEDEIFVMLEGDATFTVGEATRHAAPGEVLFGPRDVPHAYTVGDAGCRMLFAFTPGDNMESFIRASAVPARTATLPPPDVLPPPESELARILEAHELAFI